MNRFSMTFDDLLAPFGTAPLEDGIQSLTSLLTGSNTLLRAAFVIPHIPQLFSVPQIPSPVSTADFPPRPARRSRVSTFGRKRARRIQAPDHSVTCCICLLNLEADDEDTVTLPCSHSLHRLCLFSVLTAPSLGANGMLRCPLCRSSIDRHDLHTMGFFQGTPLQAISGVDTSPGRLATAARRCNAIRTLSHGRLGHIAATTSQPVCRVVARLVQQCAGTEPLDGFLYNTCVLAIERSLFHKKHFSESMQMQPPTNDSMDGVDTFRLQLARGITQTLGSCDGEDCHVDVLIRSANVVAAEYS
jgi:hypothetical protein